MLYDSYGNPVDKNRLMMEEAVPTVSGVRSILSGHPAHGLTPERLASLLLDAENGDAVAYLELAEEMEEKDLHYRSVLSTRKLQVSGLPVNVEAATDAAEDVKAADLVRDWLNSGVLSEALLDVLDAIGKGFSACEIIWDTEGRRWYPSAIVWRDPRWFVFDRADGKTLHLRGSGGEPIQLASYKYIYHVHRSKSGLPVRGGLARPATWAYLFKNFGVKSWVQFAEVYGFPFRLGTHNANATDEQKRTLLRAVRDIGQDAAAIIPEGMNIKFESGATRSDSGLFQGMADYFDRQVSKLVLGQTGTTDVGQHVGTANAHEKVREDIEQADAAQLAATLQRDLVRPLVDLNFGPRAAYPKLTIARPDIEDVNALVENVVKLVAAGATGIVELSVLRDKLGVPEPAKGAACLGTKLEAAPVAFRSAQRAASAGDLASVRDPVDDIVDAELEGWERVVSPLVNPIQRLAAECADEQEFLDRLPDVLNKQDATALARSLAESMFAARVLAETGIETGVNRGDA